MSNEHLALRVRFSLLCRHQRFDSDGDTDSDVDCDTDSDTDVDEGVTLHETLTTLRWGSG